MHCPYCKNTDTRVLDSRVADDGGSIRRRRTCSACEKRFTTVELMQLTVLKRSGATEPFTREKAIAGVRKACKGRPVTEDDLACLGQAVEDALRLAGAAEIPAHEVGMAILGPLKELDVVAYLRFASVYRSFESAEDFEEEIALLRTERLSLVEEVAQQPSRNPDTDLATTSAPSG
jgi:transcriptional repressor NrdR